MRLVWLTMLWIGFSPATIAATAEEILNQAVTAYTQAQAARHRDQRLAGFRQAQQRFEHAINQNIPSAELYTNLGNAALQAERPGSAILAYRRALVLDPDQMRAQQNLRHARTLLPAWVPRPRPEGALESFFFWRHFLNPAEQTTLAALAFLLAALLFAAALRWHSSFARNVAILPLLVWLGLLTSVIIGSNNGSTTQAVLVADETVARAADSRNAPVRFAEPLPGGTEVTVREWRTHWVHIVLANGRDAWVTRNSVEPIKTDSPDQ